MCVRYATKAVIQRRMLKVEAATLHAPFGARKGYDLTFRTGAMLVRSPRSEVNKSDEAGGIDHTLCSLGS